MLNNDNQIVSNNNEQDLNKLTIEELTQVEGFNGTAEDENIKTIDTEDINIEKLPSIESLEFYNAKDICGLDDRIRVDNPSNYPHRAICRLIITRDDGQVAVGSGWLSGEGTVTTAGHCVYSNELKKWHKSIIVIPGKNNQSEPYGRVTSSNFWSVKGWTENANQEYDYGAIILPSKMGKTVGYFGFRYDPDDAIKNLLIINSGYPADKSGNLVDTQWYMKGKIERLEERKVYYNLDTYGGNSGSSVWIDDVKYQVICIHAYGGCPNSGTRVNKEVFDNLLKWRKLGEQ